MNQFLSNYKHKNLTKMKIEKKHWIIIAVVVILIALWYFFLRKKPESKYAGMYGSFGNESNFDTQRKVDSLDANLPMIGRESNYIDIGPGGLGPVKGTGGTVKK